MAASRPPQGRARRTGAPRDRRAPLRLVVAALLGLSLGGACTGRSAAEKRERQADLHYRLGDGHFHDGALGPAIRELHTAVTLDPNHARSHHLLGIGYMGRREFELALEHLQRAVALQPGRLENRNNLGTCLLALCRWDEAQEIFSELARNPLYATPYVARNNLGLALAHRGEHAQAVPHFQKAVLYNPKFCVAYNNLGMTLLELGRVDEAERALTRALDADVACGRSYAEPHLHLGRIHERRGDAEAALLAYRRCRELTGSDTSGLGYGCGQPSVGLRCDEKIRQLETLLGSRSGDRR